MTTAVSHRVTTKGNPVIVIQGYEYLQFTPTAKRKNAKELVWVCRERKKVNCKAKLKTLNDGKTVSSITPQHNHEALDSFLQAEVARLRNEARRKIINSNLSLNEVIEQTFSEAGGEESEVGKKIGTKSYLARMLRRYSKKMGIMVDNQTESEHEEAVLPEEVRVSFTSKGKPLLVVRGQQYIRQECNDIRVHWCCRHKKKFKCYKSINTKSDGITIISKIPKHDHPVDNDEIEVLERRRSIKELVNEGMTTRAAYNLVIEDLPKDCHVVKALGTISTIDRWVRYQRNLGHKKDKQKGKTVNTSTQTEMNEEDDEIELMPIITTTKRNRPMLEIGGQQYVKQKELKSGDIRWVCFHQKRYKCSKSVITSASGHLKSKQPPHNHKHETEQETEIQLKQDQAQLEAPMVVHTTAITDHIYHQHQQIIHPGYETAVTIINETVGPAHLNDNGANYNWTQPRDATALLSEITPQNDFIVPQAQTVPTTYWNGFTTAQVITTSVPVTSEHNNQETQQSIIY